MKGKTIIVSVVILLCAVSSAQALEGELNGNVGLTYLSSYIWRGFDYYADDHSAFHSNIDLDLYGTGIGVKVLLSRAISAPFENAERISVALSYGNSLFDDENYVTDYTTGWVYYGFPDESRSGSKTSAHAQAAHMQEYFLALSWPEICPAGVVPSYTAVTMWPSEGDSAARKNSGWAHIVGFGYDFTVTGFVPEMPEQIFHFSAAMVYNDGMAPGVVINAASGTVDHDWSHAVFGISTDFDIGNNLTFTPAVYYQSSWEDTVNTEDEAWVTLGMKYAF
ncbi:MAG: hypothetical protein JSV82_00115 [Planctomycetota bacterium]|nr:MAG: hypothetical protein JSV82_00115 [Planctomycetota bacterium]